MKAVDWFVVGLRLFGVWMLLSCLNEVLAAMQAHYGMVTLRVTQPSAYWLHAVVDLIAGLVLLVCAPLLAGLLDWRTALKTDCPKCGYDMRATPDRCPECGTIPAKGE